MSAHYLYLICSPDKWYGEGSEENYKVNELLLSLDEEVWGVSNLKNIFVGMQGIIKVSRDDRPKYFLDAYGVKKLESGIYAIFEVIDFIQSQDDGNSVTIKVIHNLFKKSQIIDKAKSKAILGNKFNAQSQGYINRDTYKLVYEAINEISYIDMPKPKKELILEDNKETYPRDENEKVKALKLADYKCEIDNRHTTFLARATKENYVEGHHLIPISLYNDFDNDIDVIANIVSLCPTCHRKLHSGIKADVDELIESLYKFRKNRLSKVGLDISLEKLKKIYKEL